MDVSHLRLFDAEGKSSNFIFSQMVVKHGDLPWVQGKTPKNHIQDEEFDKTSSKDGAQKNG